VHCAKRGSTSPKSTGVFYTGSDDTFGGAMNFAQYCGICLAQGAREQPHRRQTCSFPTSNARAYLLEAGLIDCALIAYGSNQASATGKLSRTNRPFPYEAWYQPLNPLSGYALAAARPHA
jgi:hypothetical protein